MYTTLDYVSMGMGTKGSVTLDIIAKTLFRV